MPRAWAILGTSRIVSRSSSDLRSRASAELPTPLNLVWLYDSNHEQWDPNGVLTWMASELYAAELLGERVWISECATVSSLAERRH